MADNSEYEIKITTTAQGDGAKQAAQELKGLTAASQGVNEALQAQADGEKKAASVTEEFTTKKVNLSKAFKSLSHEIPIVGQVVSFLKNPYTAAIAVIAGFVVAIKKQVDAQNELARASADLATSLEPVFIHQTKLKTLMAESAVAQEDFAASFAAIAAAINPTLQALDDFNARLERRAKLGDKIAEADKQKQLAAIDLKVAQGFLDPKEAIAQRAALEAQAGAQARRGEEVALGNQINVAQQRAFRNADTIREGKAALPGAAAALQEEQNRLAKMQQDAAAAEMLRVNREEEIKKELAKKEFEISKGVGPDRGIFESASAFNARLLTEMASLRDEVARIRQARDATGASITTQQGAVAGAQTAVNEITGRITTAEQARLSSQRVADQGNQALGDTRAANRLIGASDNLTGQFNADLKILEERNRETAAYLEERRRLDAQFLKFIQDANNRSQ